MGTGTEENVKLIDKIVSWATESGVKILIALIILFVAFRVINWASKKIIAKMEKSKKLDSTLTKSAVMLIRRSPSFTRVRSVSAPFGGFTC